MRLLIYWVISAIALIASSAIAMAMGLDIYLNLEPWWKIMVGTLVLGLLNATVGLVLKFITTPLNCLTFGIAWLLINAYIFMFVGQIGGKTDTPMGYYVGNYWSAVVTSFIMGVILAVLRKITEEKEHDSPA